MYATPDWLAAEQALSSRAWRGGHLKNGTLLLYDVTSTWLEGRCSELARYGYSRDHRRDRPQLVIGLLCVANAYPVAIEVFEGNTADPETLAAVLAPSGRRVRRPRSPPRQPVAVAAVH